jgi:hypothetical protein
MGKLLLIALLVAFASATTMPTLGKVLGFGATTAGHGQGQDKDDQGEDDDGQ